MNLFPKTTYLNRRTRLCNRIKKGLVLLMGNNDAPMNYTDNIYRFRQDSTFLYFMGLNQPGLAATIDVETGETILYGSEFTLSDIIWIGPHPSLASMAERVGITDLRPLSSLEDKLGAGISAGRDIHYLPPYRHDNILSLMKMTGYNQLKVDSSFSLPLINAVIDLRSCKSKEEIVQMEEAVNITRDMHIAAIKNTAPGKRECELVGVLLNEAQKHNCHLSYPAIFTINGQTLHNHYHGNTMNDGQLALNDSGAEQGMGYAGDITRTFPVNGKFTAKQKEIYELVLDMEESSIDALKPEIRYKDVHIASNRIMIEGLKSLGLLSGSTEDMLQEGVGGLFMPHGLGHMIGLDVHDMEDLGEQYVGYRQGLERSTQLGLKSLRMARELKENFVITVEPGVYFIPQLIEKWESEGKFIDWINYDKLKSYFDFGGIRIEDDVQITKNGSRILGKPIPKTIHEIESMMS